MFLFIFKDFFIFLLKALNYQKFNFTTDLWLCPTRTHVKRGPNSLQADRYEMHYMFHCVIRLNQVWYTVSSIVQIKDKAKLKMKLM